MDVLNIGGQTYFLSAISILDHILQIVFGGLGTLQLTFSSFSFYPFWYLFYEEVEK